MTALLLIENATVRFSNKVLFKDLNFSIEPGQHWAVLGESGSGKSALLQTIAGRFNITDGGINYNFIDDFQINSGKGLNGISPGQLIALVESRHSFRNLSNQADFYYQQRYNSSDLEDIMTVERYLTSIKPVNGFVTYWTYYKVIERLKLGTLVDKQLIKLSNGETRRLTIAAALLKNPVLLLLDQPLTGLDIQTRTDFDLLFSEIAGSGIAIVMATSPNELPTVISHVALLKKNAAMEVFTRADYCEPQDDQYYEAADEQQLLLLMNIKPVNDHYNIIVAMHNVNISYHNTQVLKGINWHIKQGERWALLGPNGAGKSTLLSLINGDNPQAYANDITLFDRQRGTGESIWDIKRKIGFVSPELYQYFPVDNSCLQVVESGFYDTLGLFRASQPARAEVALRWMQALGIDQYAHNLLRNIPAGAQRLCLLARALAKNPVLLIFDEPCQGMDEHQILHFKNVVDTICALSNVTMIYVTHYQDELPRCIDNILQLAGGVQV